MSAKQASMRPTITALAGWPSVLPIGRITAVKLKLMHAGGARS